MSPEDLMKALEEATTMTAFFTGLKADLVERGWNEHNAERMVIAIVGQMGGGK